MSFEERLKEERERLGLSQEKMGLVGGVQKRAQIHYEQGERAPDASYLGAIATAGVDVLYVLTGARAPVIPSMDAAERLLVDNYRRCTDDGKAHLLQTSTLLMAGLATGARTSRRKAAAEQPAGVSIGNMHNTAPGGVQVGYAGGKISIKKGR